ncbi:diaminopimelate decarboxylase [Sinimarinibacterium sp. CAU 1509]|uniref:diaminopimelate decarboxylase n=1 Tax=Sinimarinibacterium sp. CAU 1509 TaxID=2562283 RepID=UPI0010ACD0BE|nr:diaminopimelate decarboxylase [Sinimarinibacterium sp. CAU 1509]TJY58781.1 diaminopimelate decarboxylase [Sinimarinibacterium sp. CAU 1509]
MDYFEYRDAELYAEKIPVARIAQAHGTPCYIYSRATLERHFRAFDEALHGLDHFVCYAVKANSNLAVLQVLAKLGAGFDIVSGGELFRVLKAGGEPSRIVFSGVGKTEAEMRSALEAGIYCFNVESEAELQQLNAVARQRGQRAPIALRVNPDVDAKTHPYISTGLKSNKFGVDIATAERLYLEASKLDGIEIVGVASHIGSQLLDVSPFLDALDRVLALIDRLQTAGIKLRHIDVGGGLGVRYLDENPPEPRDWALAIRPKLADRGLRILTEPGRAIAGNAGILVTKVLGLKGTDEKSFAIVDAAMNDLLRPTLYQAWMNIVPVKPRSDVPERNYDVVGPVCETGDWLGKDRALAIKAGDLLAVRTAGAYGFTMASNYNTRPRAAEVLVDDDFVHLVRERETLEDLVRGERLLP